MSEDIRWKQRFNHFKKAFEQLSKFIAKGELSELEKQGMIQSFEYTYELAWNTMKDFYENQGETGIQGSRDAIQLAFKRGLIADGEGWMEMIKSRTKTVHTYNELTANEISDAIVKKYYNLFLALIAKFELLQV